jgi:hypothetical protein
MNTNSNNEKILRELATVLVSIGGVLERVVIKVQAVGIGMGVLGFILWSLGAGGGLLRMGLTLVVSCLGFVVLVNFARGWLAARQGRELGAGHE